jgi:hypothetical protein
MSLTGSSKPSDTACRASAARLAATGSSVKLISWNAADRTLGSRPLPSSLASSAFAAASAPFRSLWM